MPIIALRPRGVNHQNSPPRTRLRSYSPANAPEITACVTYNDPTLGIVARSERGSRGLLDCAAAICWDCGVLDALQAAGVGWLETHIKTTRTTYRTPIATMLEHGALQQRRGMQRVLSLRYWDVDGQPAAASPATTTNQPSLFETESHL